MPWWGWIGVAGFTSTLALVALVILSWAAKRGEEAHAYYQRQWNAEARELRALRRRHDRHETRSHAMLVGDLRMPERRVSR
jgi:hypothetical protein